jgi:hypothetical protein
MPGDTDCGTPRKWHGVSLGRRGRPSLSRIPPCRPPRCNQGAPAAATCTSITPRPRPIRSTPCIRNEKLSLTTRLITKMLTNPLAQSRSTADSGYQSPASGPDHLTGRLSMAWNKVASDTVALLSAEAGRHPRIGAPGPHRGAVRTKRRIRVRWAARTSRSTAPASSSSTTRSSAHLHHRAWVALVVRPGASWPGPRLPTASSRPPGLIPRSRLNRREAD